MPTKRLSVLSQESCERIHRVALRLLDRVGVAVADPETCQILQQAGARVDGTGTVYLPASLIQEALAKVPKSIELAGSDGCRFRLPTEEAHYASRVKYPRQQGYPPTETHVPTRQEIANNCRLANAMSEAKAVFVLDGDTADLSDVENWVLTPATVLSTTPKHVISPAIHLRSASQWVGTAEAASQSGDLTREPLLTLEVSPHGPLKLDADTAQIELLATRKGIPLLVLPIPMAGVTSPLTLAGTVAVGVAESLFMITLAQLVRPGTPILYGGNALTFNMRTTAVSLGDPEAALLGSAEVAMAHFYGIPNYRVTGFTDAFFPDVQAGIEKALSTFVGLASGAHLVCLGGTLGTSTIISYEQLLIDHDLFQVAQRITREIEVTEDTLALEVIEAIGHRGGDYLSHEHTVKWLHGPERYFGGLFNRTPALDANQTMLANAHRRVEEILALPNDGAVPGEVRERVSRYVKKQTGRTLDTQR
jgi:trimethylamine--corrinoid protein Co-methyltransferase